MLVDGYRMVGSDENGAADGDARLCGVVSKCKSLGRGRINIDLLFYPFPSSKQLAIVMLARLCHIVIIVGKL